MATLGGASAVRITEVQEALDNLDGAQCRLSEVIGKIEERLDRVLSRQNLDKQQPVPGVPGVQKCPLADTIQSYAETAKGLRSRLEIILQRIEL